MKIRPAIVEGILVNENQFLKRVNLHAEEVLHSGLGIPVTSQCQLQVMFDKQTDLTESGEIPDVLDFSSQPFPQFSNCNLTAGLIHIGLIFAVIRDKELNHGAQGARFSVFKGGISNQF